MKKVLFLALLFLTGFASVFAGERQDSELKALALRQFGKSVRLMSPSAVNKVTAGSLNVQRTFSNGNVVAYSADGVGSVLLSVDDRCIPVLGYTAAIVRDGAEMPCGMKWWIEEMNRQLDAAVNGTSETTSSAVIESPRKAAATPVTPLLTTYWDQSAPFNSMCPMAAGGQGVTGCVATAIAQILNYNRYPTSASFTGGYTIDGSEDVIQGDVNSTYTYPYNDAYGGYYPDGENASMAGYSPAQGKAVGALMRDCGYAVFMDYGAEASGANDYGAANAFMTAFKYPEASMKYMNRAFYSDAEWHNTLNTEFAKGSPVYFAGTDYNNGGHAFVLDGVDADGLVHVNWGWSGAYNGYYSLEAMKVPNGYNFSNNQRMFIGIRSTPLTDDKCKSLWAYDGCEFISDATGLKCALNLQPGAMIINQGLVDFMGYLGVVIADVNTPDDLILCETFLNITADKPASFGAYIGANNEAIELDFTMAMVKSMKRGHTYKVYLASISDDELAANEASFMRQIGGIGYFLIEYSAGGKFIIKDKGIDTGISSVVADDPANGKMFNISGSQVDDSFKGIVIKSGRKYIKK